MEFQECWLGKLNKRLTLSELVNVLESEELEVKSILIPTEVELEKVYWKELTLCVEEEDTDPHDSKGNEIEHDDVVRMEIEKLEERLLGVISKRLDQMEYKIDSLVELAAMGDIVQIEDTGCDLPKGRRHRTKRKARLLCSPFTNLTKRRKLSDIDVYDPYREVDPSKVDDLNKWMEVASTSDLVPLHRCDVEAKYLLDLLNKDGWLTGESAHGEWQIHTQSPRKEDFKFSKSLLKYVDESTIELGKSWKDYRYLYAPCCAIGSHWFAVKIELEGL
ncbi:Ulp1 protease family protein [Abeliophyllum distichum]|uniref:Ulp1 protease family protein n=1 Tax=Abeliophyllum distichum TaxID=126358 RepID=A0ABD1RT90_9LAMI